MQIPEVLLWAREQSEELSPNLTTFTEHFNKMSYWLVTLTVSQSVRQTDSQSVTRTVIQSDRCSQSVSQSDRHSQSVRQTVR